jgi:spore coat polysaccharide biosynthesis protein SpsF
MNSKRLPNKALKLLCGKTILERVVMNLQLSKKITNIIVATSKSRSDDLIELFCKKKKIKCYRGALKNVYQRYYQLIKSQKIKNFIRITGDSPLIDYRIIEKGIELFEKGNFDMVTNSLQRTYPQGQSVEIINSEVFCRVKKKIKEKDYKEHITKYFYNNKRAFKIKNFFYQNDISHLNLSVNTRKDYEFIKDIVSRLEDNKADLKKIIKYCKNRI